MIFVFQKEKEMTWVDVNKRRLTLYQNSKLAV